MACFLYEYVFTCYGLPIEIVSDRGKHFLSKIIKNLLDKFMVLRKKFYSYHSQENDQVESTKKTLKMVLTEIVSAPKMDRELKLTKMDH